MSEDASSGRPRVLSGIQPTHDSFHVGNYLGALKQWVDLQNTHEAFYCVVDMHAITVRHDPTLLRRRTRVSVAQLLALGLDPDRCTVFVQSHVPEHAELEWVLACITGYGEATRMTQFKDKAGSQQVATVGLFTYPVLQAADILLYQADSVPVGEDQRQHLELTRNLAQRFNTRFGRTFTVPEPHILASTAKIMDLQNPTGKMSKSSDSPGGTLELLDEPSQLRRKIMRAVTDTGTEVRASDDKPGVTNLLRILSGITGARVSDLEARYADSGYGAFKKDVAEAVLEWVAPVQETVRDLLDDERHLDTVLADGAQRARAVALTTMAEVRDRIGFLPLTPPAG
jgi:tryptophanyl-tRNA synthetase